MPPLPRVSLPLLAALLAAALAVAPPPSAARASAAPGADTLPPLLVSLHAAQAGGLRVGDVVRVSADPAFHGARRMRVAGILPLKADPVDVGRGLLWVKMHFTDMAAITERPDDADEVILAARDSSSVPLLRDRLNAMAVNYHAYTSEELARRTSQTFEVISRFHQAISLITLAAGAVFLLAILLFKVEERRHELGALRLIGIRRRSLLLFLCAEALVIAAVGSFAGLLLGRITASGLNAYYQRYYQTTLVFASVTPGVAAAALLLGAGFGLLAGLAVSARVLRAAPLDLLGR